MKKIISFVSYLLFIVFAFSSCQETDETTKEWDNWQERNDQFFTQIYNQAQNAIKADSKDWKIIKCYTKSNSTTNPNDFIVAEILNKGEGTVSPIFTDSVKIHYEGRLMPSTTYPQGYRFDSSWTGEYNLDIIRPYKATCGTFIDGFTTALQYMHEGDRWKVYIPYNLGYKESSQTGIPAYSTLIFDITLQKVWHADPL